MFYIFQFQYWFVVWTALSAPPDWAEIYSEFTPQSPSQSAVFRGHQNQSKICRRIYRGVLRATMNLPEVQFPTISCIYHLLIVCFWCFRSLQLLFSAPNDVDYHNPIMLSYVWVQSTHRSLCHPSNQILLVARARATLDPSRELVD